MHIFGVMVLHFFFIEDTYALHVIESKTVISFQNTKNPNPTQPFSSSFILPLQLLLLIPKLQWKRKHIVGVKIAKKWWWYNIFLNFHFLILLLFSLFLSPLIIIIVNMIIISGSILWSENCKKMIMMIIIIIWSRYE